MKQILISVIFICLLAGCKTTPVVTTPVSSPAGPLPSETSSTEVPVDWENVYREFIKSDTPLPEALNYGIYGVGLADLDIDGIPELILFDSGASAACGVNFFDIDSDGNVICVSAASDYKTSETAVSVYANGPDDFHLLKLKNGTMMFYCVSGNGSDIFQYVSYIGFERGEHLELRELCYKYEEFDDVTYDVKSSEYRVDSKEATEGEYLSALDSLTSGATEQNYKVATALLWVGGYNSDKAGAVSMFDDALNAYQPITD